MNNGNNGANKRKQPFNRSGCPRSKRQRIDYTLRQPSPQNTLPPPSNLIITPGAYSLIQTQAQIQAQTQIQQNTSMQLQLRLQNDLIQILNTKLSQSTQCINNLQLERLTLRAVCSNALDVLDKKDSNINDLNKHINILNEVVKAKENIISNFKATKKATVTDNSATNPQLIFIPSLLKNALDKAANHSFRNLPKSRVFNAFNIQQPTQSTDLQPNSGLNCIKNNLQPNSSKQQETNNSIFPLTFTSSPPPQTLESDNKILKKA